ncbi:hypothetical protein ACH4YN_37925 [Streptomyces griseofuscus]|uniref:hypothetical protein n=1 Tax=Streptomyces griseofuscus TaxID=146922 RepID=UPI0037A57C7A
MPAHIQVFARLAMLLASTSDPEQRDMILDVWLDARHMASEWDAEPWGFEPGWCRRELNELMRRGRSAFGVVQLDDAL